MIVSPIEWNSPSVASNTAPNNPPGCPPGCQYVPRTQRTPMIHSAHSSRGTGHPGANNTPSLLRDRFWWPNMARDVRRFVQGCPDCAMSKSPRHLPSGKLLPLPVPNRPWSHLGVDFVTDLPPSEGNTCILVIVDRFSKSCRLLPLRGLPTALETAELLFNQVFRYYGIPEDIVSDRGPQFLQSMECLPTLRCDWDIRLRLPCKKLSPRFVGPFTILEQVNSVTYKLQLPSPYIIHPTFHVSLLKPHHEPVSLPTEPGQTEEPPLPLILDEGSVYKVKEILQSRRRYILQLT
ncbi:uncharacterized protein LOC107692676 [Sinocyclocheilus anshuiensis]|uniref:uncharacterized protein LOC107692676 n=1 Tax=Sinocyclocheilus anshuiensis TaxID=1608454 RepID=UPI0007B9416E|nr:PREDICTED: uncharacterized protein LOC107692676 [Sinocyclocheilus anshuiensis]